MKYAELIVVCGLPGSGKTTTIKELYPDYAHISSDDIREELYGDASCQDNPDMVFFNMRNRTLENLDKGISVVYDATNLTRKDRAFIIDSCPKYVAIKCLIIWAPIEECIKRDSGRNRVVGEHVIKRMVRRFQMPYFDEGFEEIQIEKTFIDKSYKDNVIDSLNISHDNPHHTYSISEHCAEAYKYCIENKMDDDVRVAALYHDVGKPFVKSFKNSKGEVTDIAHYYNHENVGAYISIGLDIPINSIWLISTHMEPFHNSKYYRNLPQFLKEAVDTLHTADINAH